jgi:hypothetical protein
MNLYQNKQESKNPIGMLSRKLMHSEDADGGGVHLVDTQTHTDGLSLRHPNQTTDVKI